MSLARKIGERNQAVDQNNTTARPFIKWAGGKRQLLEALLANIPPRFNSYFEPMIGAGALFFRLQPNPATISDINAQLIETYIAVRDSVDELIVLLQQHEFSPDYFYALRNADREAAYAEWTPLQRASRFIYLNRTCFNGLYRVDSKGQFNVPIGRYSNPRICDAVGLRAASRALQRCSITTAPFTEIEERSRPGDFVYFDPPYAPLTTTANFTGYTLEGFGASQQESLRDLCVRLDAKGVHFLLSNSATPLIYELYQGFNLQEVRATRAINSRATKRGTVAELLVRNY